MARAQAVHPAAAQGARAARRARDLDRAFAELLIDCEEDRVLRAVLVEVLREDDRY